MGGCPVRLINKLQLVQNASVTVLTRTRKYDHIIPVRLQHCISSLLNMVYIFKYCWLLTKH